MQFYVLSRRRYLQFLIHLTFWSGLGQIVWQYCNELTALGIQIHQRLSLAVVDLTSETGLTAESEPVE